MKIGIKTGLFIHVEIVKKLIYTIIIPCKLKKRENIWTEEI